jgi:hypothetical protein
VVRDKTASQSVRRKKGNEMKINRQGLAPHEDEDLTRFHFARGSLLLCDVADRLSDVVHGGKHLTENDLRRMHTDLRHVWDILGERTIASIGPDEGATDDAAIVRHRSTYSDGSPVSHVQSLEVGDDPVPQHFRESRIAPAARTMDSEVADVPRRSSSVRVELPPHQRPNTSAKKGSRTHAQARKRPVAAVAPAEDEVTSLRARLEAFR